MKKIYTAVTLLAFAVTGSAASADKKKHEEKFCSALSALNEDLAKLDTFGPSTTVGELRTTARSIEKNSTNVSTQARKIDTPASKQLTQSTQQLATETRRIPDNMTLGQFRSRIEGDVSNVKRDAATVATQSGCLEAMPTGSMGGAKPPQQAMPPK